MSSERYKILLTFDVEDWFQVENFKPYIPFSTWPNRELRVEQNTHKLLDLLDQKSHQPPFRQRRIGSDHFHPESDPDKNKSQESGKSCLTESKATFFVLGWIAERLPGLVREIHSRGHEVASHGYSHELCNNCSQADLEKDLVRSKKLLEDIIGEPVYGYRAPSFSINDDILKIIEECGYLYDSSYNSFGIHGRYGKISLNGNRRSGIAYQISNAFCELPISNLPLFLFPTLGNSGIPAHFRHFCLPWGGGAYFRLIPFPLFKIGAKLILGRQNACLFYFHPWEIDPDQPKVIDASPLYRFRHYVNLNKTYSKLSQFIKDFAHCSFIKCQQYLKTAPDL